MAVLDALYWCSVKITIVDFYLLGQKESSTVKRVNNQYLDRLVTEQRKQLLRMLYQYVKVVNTSQLRLLVLYDLKSAFM